MTNTKLQDSKYLFVYGTLMQDSKHDMHTFLASNSKHIGNGYFHGKLYEVAKFPGAILSKNPDHKVFGQVYKLYNIKTVFEVLDIYEGIDHSIPEPNLYKREQITVMLEHKTQLRAWTYLYNLSVANLQHIPSGKYYNF